MALLPLRGKPDMYPALYASDTSYSVNAVDVLYAAFPMYMYLNPDLGGYLLKPLLEYQNTDMYTLPYAALNIGTLFLTT